MRILVTGGSGFIGRNLVEYLGRDHEVMAPSHRALDLCDQQTVDRWFADNEVDAVVHGAVQPGHRLASSAGQLSTNLRMFYGLLRHAHRFSTLVMLSSGAVYDAARAIDRVSEEEVAARIPFDEHGLSKYVIAQQMATLHEQDGLRTVEIRLFGVFGRHEDYRIRFISNAICRTLLGLPITLRQNREFSYLYIDDLGPIVGAALGGRLALPAYNAVPPWTNELTELAELVADAAGGVPIVVANEGTGLPYSGSGDKLAAALPDFTCTRPRDAVAALYEWYRARVDDIDPRLVEADR
jgi:UDP-glucose 4-epimerase